LPLARSPENRLRYAVDAAGRPAETKYQVIKTFSKLSVDQAMEGITKSVAKEDLPKHLTKKLQQTYQGFSLVNCWPKTGRTHQIRVHLAHLRHPILSDEIYLGPKRVRLDTLWCPRLFLHAQEIQFLNPRSQEPVQYHSDLPLQLQQALELLVE
jgi:23S rRNA-/tRNA-specific pseudouridylate synthase